MGADLLLIPKITQIPKCLFSLCFLIGSSLCRPRVKGIAESDYHILPSDLMSFWKFDHYALWVHSGVILYFSAYKPWAMTSDQPLCGRAYLQGGGGRGFICKSKKATEKTDIMRQWKSLLENMKKMYCIINCFTHKKLGIKAFIQDGLCVEELIHGEAYTWSKTNVKEKEGTYLQGTGRGVL